MRYIIIYQFLKRHSINGQIARESVMCGVFFLFFFFFFFFWLLEIIITIREAFGYHLLGYFAGIVRLLLVRYTNTTMIFFFLIFLFTEKYRTI